MIYDFFYFVFFLDTCEQINGNPEFISSVFSNPYVFSEHLLPHNGASFNSLPIEIIFKLVNGNEVPIKKISLSNPETNVKKLIVELFNSKNELVELKSLLSPNLQFTVISTEPISAIRINILQVSDNTGIANNVAFSIIGDVNCETTFSNIPTSGFSSLSSGSSISISPTNIIYTTPSCVLSEWSDWSNCSIFCNQENRTRSREVLSGVCLDELLETQKCNITDCSCIMDRNVLSSLLNKTVSTNFLVGTYNGSNVFVDDVVPRGAHVTVDECTEIVCDSNGLEVLILNCSGNF